MRKVRLNVEKKTYSTRELDAVLGSLDKDASMRQVINKVKGMFTSVSAHTIISTGTEMCLRSASWAVVNALEENRRKSSMVSKDNTAPVACDDDQITIGELREAIRRDGTYWLTSVPTIDATVDKLAKSIFDAREPEWLAGDVVRDADGKFWKRTFGGKPQAWASFETALYSSFDIPKRPLEKVS